MTDRKKIFMNIFNEINDIEFLVGGYEEMSEDAFEIITRNLRNAVENIKNELKKL